MTEPQTATVLLGRAGVHDKYLPELAAEFGRRVEQPVAACLLDGGSAQLAGAIRDCGAAGARQIGFLPVALSQAEIAELDVTSELLIASRRWPFLQFHPGQPIGIQPGIVQALIDRAKEAAKSNSAVLIAAIGSDDAESNADVARAAHLVAERTEFPRVSYGLLECEPALGREVDHLVRSGYQQIVIVPLMLFASAGLDSMKAVLESRASTARISLAQPLFRHDGLLDALAGRSREALHDISLLPEDSAKFESYMEGTSGPPLASMHRGVGDSFGTPDFENAMSDILPPRYLNDEREVSSAPMAAADLVYNRDGSVAWDRIWGADDPDNPFCELALAGGPPHRGTLLEPPLAESVLDKPYEQARVLAEIERGIQMITGYPVRMSEIPGWIGIACDDDEMAIWLMRAIIVENVMVRREEHVLYLPAGPDFELDREIKNVVTVVAKTFHYWTEHITARRLLRQL